MSRGQAATAGGRIRAFSPLEEEDSWEEFQRQHKGPVGQRVQ